MPDLRLELLRQALGKRFDIRKQVSHSAIGPVYVARDLRRDCEATVEFVEPALVHSLGWKRLLKALEAASKLKHRGILAPYDFGPAGDAIYAVTELAEEQSLRDLLREEGRLDAPEVARITMAVAEAVDYAHGVGVIHCDLKPENILLKGDEVRVVDFGIGPTVRTLRAGLTMGTPAYMAPERALGGEPGPAADVYALGCIVYEMLAGRPPFTGKPAQVLEAHVRGVAPLVRQARPDLPEAVESVLFRALAKRPDKRFSAAVDLAELVSELGAQLKDSAPRHHDGATGPLGLEPVGLEAADEPHKKMTLRTPRERETRTEAYAVARLIDHQPDAPVVVGRPLRVEAGVQLEPPEEGESKKFSLPQGEEAINFDLAVYAEDMEIKEAWTQRFVLKREGRTPFALFQLVPLKRGKKRIEVEYYWRLHWLARVCLNVEVVELVASVQAS